MKILFDTNILLDVFQRRVPFFDDSKRVYDLAVSRDIEGFVSVMSLKDIFYMCSRSHGADKASGIIEATSGILGVLGVSPEDSTDAMGPDRSDYEDGLIMASAKSNGIDAIVTRDAFGFHDSDVAVFHPRDIGKYIKSDVSCGKVVL
jgi:predicted nucleic acid-binding protein